MESFIAQVPGPVVWSLAALALYAISIIIYNLYFHPLRHYPGPLLYRASRFPRALRILNGKWPRELVDLSEKYGPVVRVAPGMLVYTNAEAWKDIFGHQNGAVVKGEEFEKDAYFYRARNVPPNILSESRENHSLIRRQLSHGFSDKSLRAQESIIKGYVDLFIQRIKERCVPRDAGEDDDGSTTTTTTTAFDMRHWFNYATFDIIGDLAFGEPFGCLEKGELDPRVAFMEQGLATASKTYFVKELGLERFLKLVAMRSAKFRQALVDSMAQILQRRMSLTAERPDLIEGLLKKKDDWTTATLLTGATFLLLKNPETLQKLQDEIRGAFKSEDQITFSSVENLPYMLAVFKEALRFYPPVTGEMPRIVPKGGATVAGQFVPEGTTVATAQYAMNHTSRNFTDSFAFKPERFLQVSNTPALAEKKKSYPGDNFDVLQPFSTGPRNCVGKNLANAEMRTIMARLVWNFDMELVDPEDNWMDQKAFFLWIKPPLNVNLTPVQR
ncbi:hypothetical protein N0V82_001982 [Gnomoniopsis sp. IMI 355080]|nr:hypothetical protein N0V82_001982 [Gnomoniopsis sp. IMI 355080]